MSSKTNSNYIYSNWKCLCICNAIKIRKLLLIFAAAVCIVLLQLIGIYSLKPRLLAIPSRNRANESANGYNATPPSDAACAPVLLDMASGRLGNRIFYLAAVLGISHATHKPPLIRPETMSFLDEIFANVGEHAGAAMTLPGHPIRLDAGQSGTFLAADMELPCERPAILSSHHQSFKYFWPLRETIRRIFTRWKSDTAAACEERWAKVAAFAAARNASRVVGIHIRRGDFLWRSDKGYGVVTPAYIANATRAFEERWGPAVYVVVGTDVGWNGRHVASLGPHFFLSQPMNPGADLCLLSKCFGAVISTGTFSWWAGFLSGGPVLRPTDFAVPGSLIASLYVEGVGRISFPI